MCNGLALLTFLIGVAAGVLLLGSIFARLDRLMGARWTIFRPGAKERFFQAVCLALIFLVVVFLAWFILDPTCWPRVPRW